MSYRKLVLTIMAIAVAILGLTLTDILQEAEFVWQEVAIDLADRLMTIGSMAVVAWTVHGLIDLRERQVAMGNNLACAAAQAMPGARSAVRKSRRWVRRSRTSSGTGG